MFIRLVSGTDDALIAVTYMESMLMQGWRVSLRHESLGYLLHVYCLRRILAQRKKKKKSTLAFIVNRVFGGRLCQRSNREDEQARR